MKRMAWLWILAAAMAVSPAWMGAQGGDAEKEEEAERIRLPAPRLDGPVAVEAAIHTRRSVRSYAAAPLTLGEVAQLLWAAYGITKPLPRGPAFLRGGLRAAPSAGALYPLEVYLVAGKVTGLPAGVYRYVSKDHALDRVHKGDRRGILCRAAFDQAWVCRAPATLVFTAIFSRTTGKYGSGRGERYVWMDAGCACENVYLQARALALGCCIVGAFQDVAVWRALNLSRKEEPLCIISVGREK